jgi:rhamnosyltransferase
VVAVVTSYRPSAELISNVVRIAAQVDSVIVVDDGSGDEYDSTLVGVAQTGAEVIRLAKNVGIAAALNRGVAAVRPSSDDLVVTFDQDSAAPTGFVDALVSRMNTAIQQGVNVGLVAPETFAGHRQTIPGRRDVAREPIQSGTLYRGLALRRMGAFDEGLFIDLVDVDYYLRLRSLGFVVLAVPGLDLPHELGCRYHVTVWGRPVIIHGRELTTSLSAPFRYYYRARNRVVIDSRYPGIETRARRRDRILEWRHLMFVIAYARPRRNIIRVLSQGRRAGHAQEMGRIPPEIEKLADAVSWATIRAEARGTDGSPPQRSRRTPER